jgi:hypothetical protein
VLAATQRGGGATLRRSVPGGCWWRRRGRGRGPAGPRAAAELFPSGERGGGVVAAGAARADPGPGPGGGDWEGEARTRALNPTQPGNPIF